MYPNRLFVFVVRKLLNMLQYSLRRGLSHVFQIKVGRGYSLDQRCTMFTSFRKNGQGYQYYTFTAALNSCLC